MKLFTAEKRHRQYGRRAVTLQRGSQGCQAKAPARVLGKDAKTSESTKKPVDEARVRSCRLAEFFTGFRAGLENIGDAQLRSYEYGLRSVT